MRTLRKCPAADLVRSAGFSPYLLPEKEYGLKPALRTGEKAAKVPHMKITPIGTPRRWRELWERVRSSA